MTATPTTPTFSRENDHGALVWLPVERIYDNPFQPRLNYDDIDNLADSIWALKDELPATLGLQQPPVARVVRLDTNEGAIPIDRDTYTDPTAMSRLALSDKHGVELHFGHRRLRAWRLLRNRDVNAYATFPVFLAYADDRAMWRHVMAENAQRKNIGPVEEALSLDLAIKRFGMTLEEAGAPFGFAKPTVSNKVRLLKLPEWLQAELQAGHIGERHARALLRLAPAPHLWDKFEPDDLLDIGALQLERQIAKLIADQTPLAPAAGTGYARYNEYWDGRVEQKTAQHDPQPWPYDWTPGKDSKIVGACIGCRYRATFAGEAGQRCTEPEKTCLLAKHQAWREEEAARQAAAMETAATQIVQAVAPTPAANPVHGAAIAGRAAAPSALPAKAPDEGTRESDITWFNRQYGYSAPAALVDKGLCNSERCECFVLAFNSKANGREHVRPDPEHAPNMCYGCTSAARLNRRKKELEVGDLNEHYKRVKAEQIEAERLITEAFADYSMGELWNNRTVLAGLAVGAGRLTFDSVKLAGKSIQELQAAIFRAIAFDRCHYYSGSKDVWNLDRLRAWLEQLAIDAGRIAPQIGMIEDKPMVQS